MVESTATPVSDDPVLVAFLKDLAATRDQESVVNEYARRYPDREAEFRTLAELRRNLNPPEPADQDEAPAPQRLGDFRIVRQIAHGGMGTIYEAIQEPLGRRVAVKTVLGHNMHLASAARERFLREQKVLAQLHHTHIVPIHAAGSEGPLLYFAMSYIDGAALHHVVRTALLHEMSSHGSHAHTPTPTLAELAAEAKSSTHSGESPERNGTSGNGQHLAAESTTATLPVVDPPRPDARADNEAPPTHSENGNGKLFLSPGYFRSVARVMLDAAEAVHHAHEAGIIHRDLKPSNLMVDTAEHCWVLDFGLAGYLRAEGREETRTAAPIEGKPEPDLEPEPQQPFVSAVQGTPDYMAPEQFQRKADVRTDVWGLGVTLYELLTLSRAFHSQHEIESADPPRPSTLVHGVPRDLEAICLNALRRDHGQRYPSARALADDLQHWLKSEPVRARPAHTLRRVGLWARRNKGWAAAIAVAALALASLSLGGIIVSKVRADAFRGVALAAQRESQILKREASIQQMQRIRLTYQRGGWSRDAWDLARRVAAESPPGDARIKSEAAACLAGLDVSKVKTMAFPGLALAFDPTGTRLMFGGVSLFRPETERPIQIWDSATDQVRAAGIKGGETLAFAFRPDRSPLLLKVPNGEPLTAQLWDVDRGRLLRTFKLPLEGKSKIQALALTPDGSWIAAAARQLDERGEPANLGAVAVWEASSGRQILHSANSRATEVALAPDGGLLALGFEDGHISVWSLPQGKPLDSLRFDRNPIQCLSFGRDPVQPQGGSAAGSGWLLASGDRGGALIVWDVASHTPRSICHSAAGSSEVLSLTFSPEGTTLASAGGGKAQLWDLATGQLLLNVDASNYTAALAFSPDGRRLAVGCVAAFGAADKVDVWKLEPGRGIDSLRGLSQSVFSAVFSPDGRLVGALANDWRVGIWDRASRRLIHVLEVTRGSFPDNAALAFSPDGTQFAFSVDQEASLWDVVTGELVKTWKFPQGLSDRLAFPVTNRLLLFRVETESGELGPFTQVDAIKYPRVCRVRDLLGPHPNRPVAEIRDCNLHVFGSECSPDGKYYVIEGLASTRGKISRVANLYEGPTGKKLGPLPDQKPAGFDSASFNFDPTGGVLNYFYEATAEGSRAYFLEMPSLAVLRQFDQAPYCLCPRAKRWVLASPVTADQPGALSLFDQELQDPLIRFLPDLGGSSWTGRPQFSPNGLHLVWGNPGGVVTVVDLVEVNRRLSEIGLSW